MRKIYGLARRKLSASAVSGEQFDARLREAANTLLAPLFQGAARIRTNRSKRPRVFDAYCPVCESLIRQGDQRSRAILRELEHCAADVGFPRSESNREVMSTENSLMERRGRARRGATPGLTEMSPFAFKPRLRGSGGRTPATDREARGPPQERRGIHKEFARNPRPARCC